MHVDVLFCKLRRVEVVYYELCTLFYMSRQSRIGYIHLMETTN